MRQRFVFALAACLLLLSGTIVSCASKTEEARTIRIGVIGPMQFVQGEDLWYGAEIARDIINASGGISIGGKEYLIELVKADSNEILNPAGSSSIMERLIMVDKADFVIGGFRTEAVLAMQDVAMDHHEVFLGCGSGSEELCTRVGEDYDRYKYWFRISPLNNADLANNSLLLLEMTGAVMKQELNIEDTLKVAILAENATWADAMVETYKEYIPQMLGMEVVGEWRPSAVANDVTNELSAIEASGAHLILTALSGPVGITYAKQLSEQRIPAASIGLNVEAQKDGFWKATDGYGEYETTLNTYTMGAEITIQTRTFVELFFSRFGRTPTYNATSYDAVYVLKEAIERAETLDADAVVDELEKTDTSRTMGRLVFTGTDTSSPHDVTCGPGYVTGIATQWQDEAMKCVWPLRGLYRGIVQWQIPTWVRDRFELQ